MLAKLSVKKPYTVIVAIILVIALGVISFMNMTTDLLPSMDLPYMIVYTTYTGATPERVETDVTRPLESTFTTLTDVKNVSSTSSENVSMVIMEFEAGADMNTAMIEISSQIDQLSGGWDDAIGTPVIMKLNPDMLPVTISTVSLEDAELLELSDYVTDELIPEYEAVDGVARVSASGILTQQVDITIEQSRIDALNNAILDEVDSKLAKVERQLREAQSQISSGKSQLARMRRSTYAQIDEALKAIEQGEKSMPQAIAGLEAQKEQLTAQLESAKAVLAQLEAMVNMSDEQKEQLKQLAQQLAQLEKQRDELQKQLDNLGEDAPSDALSQQLTDAQKAREEQAQMKASLEQYIADLNTLDKDSLEKTIKQLEESIAADNKEITEVRGQLETAIVERDAAQLEVNDLTERLNALRTPAPTATPTPEPTAEPTPEPTEEPTREATEEATQAPADEVTGEPAEEVTDAPAEEVTEAPTEESTETPSDEATEAPAEDVTGEPTEEVTEAPSEEATETPTEESTEAPSEEITDAPTEEVTEAPTEEATDAPAEEVAEAPVEAATEAPAKESEPENEQPEQDSSEQESEPEQEPAPAGEAASEPAPASEPAQQEAVSDVPKPAEEESRPEETAKEESKPEEAAKEPKEETLAASIWNRLTGTAYAEEVSITDLEIQLAEAQARLDTAQASVDSLSARHETLRESLNDQEKALKEAKESLALLEEGEIAVQSRVEAAQQQIAGCDARIAELDQEIADITAAIQQGDIRQQLVAQIAQLDTQITAIKESDAYKAYLAISNGKDLNSQYAQAQEGVAQLEAGIASIDSMLGKLNQGIIPGGMIEGIDEDTNLADAKAQLEAARKQASKGFSNAWGQISDAEDKIASAWSEFKKNRDEALEEAGIDGIITVETISGILGSQNLELPAGYALNGEDRYLVSIGKEFASLAELKQIKLFSLGLDNVDDVRLLDVANVQINDNSDDLFTFVNGERGIMLSFEKQSTASTAEVAENITARSEELMAENPKLQVVEMMNQGDYIDLIVSSVLDNLVSGGALAILVLLLFLMDWRPTLIVAISIPVSVVVAFVCMYFSGITLNVMSLSGLALGVGMLVDNSIVTIENIYRLRDEENLPLLTACIRGVNQVSGALISSTLTTICVFLPVVFIEGMARDLFTDMGLTIAFSLIASLVVAMTVVPSFAATLFRKSKPGRQRFFKVFQAGYVKILRGALKAKLLVLLLAVALLVFSGYQVLDMPISFMPSVNSEQMSASLSFEDPDMPDSEKESAALSVMEEILQVEGVQDVSLSAADSTSLMSMGAGGYSYYTLVDMDSGRTNHEIAEEMRSRAAKYADGERIIFGVQESTMDLSAMAGSGITITITGDNIDDLQRTAKEIAQLCQQVPGAINIDDGAEDLQPKLMVTVDKEKANDNSLSVAQVYQYVAQRLYGAIELTDATLDGREYTIYVSEDKNIDLTIEDVENMEIEVDGVDESKFVRIGDIAGISEGTTLASISRANQRRSVTVSFELAEGYSANLVSRDLEAVLEGYAPPKGCDFSIGGENETVMGYMEDLVYMLLVAILFIFLIMVAQFQSFKSPIIVMFTIPLAFTGGLLALVLTKMDLSIVAMVGFVVLSGVIVNNGIVFIDSVNQMRIGGMKKKDAIIETGRIRLRPILMTALTTILGMSTMALATGMGAEMMQPMAIVTIGGLSYGTLMTLFVVPVLYDIFNGEKMKAREIEMMKEAAGMQREGFDDSAPAAIAAPEKAPETEKEPEIKAEEVKPEEPKTEKTKPEPIKPVPTEPVKRVRIKL